MYRGNVFAAVHSRFQCCFIHYLKFLLHFTYGYVKVIKKIVNNLLYTIVERKKYRITERGIYVAKIIRKTLGQEAAKEIREMILNGELEQGASIVEQDMADRLGVSRGPVREALHQLTQEGLVEYETNRGCFVREVSELDIVEYALLQIQLELAVLKLLGGNLPEKTLEKMEQIVSEMELENENITYEKMLEEDKDFHRCIMEILPLKKMLQIWDGLNQGNMISSKWFSQDEESLIKLHRELHRKLLEAFRTKDMALIYQAMMQHYVDSIRRQVSIEKLGIDLKILLQS